MVRFTRVIIAAALLGAAACKAVSTAGVAVAPEFVPGPAEPREQTADQQVAQVLSRLTFGARPGDAERVRAIGVDRWIDWQLHPERIDDGKAEQYFSGFESYATSAADMIRKYPPPNQLLNRLGARGDRSKLSSADSALLEQSTMGVRRITTEAQAGRVARALLTERQLQEVMTDFWLNHFTVYIQKNPQERYQLADYENKTIRPNALGKFRTLLEAVAKSPAMLIYLDNALSQADSSRPRLVAGGGGRGGPGVFGPPGLRPGQQGQLPLPPGVTPEMAAQRFANRRVAGLNENYGRELLELHTLGVDGGYTQQDVINVARALTGWTVEPPQRGGGGFYFAPAMHDAGEKVVLGRMLKAGRGMEDGEDVLDIVSRHPATAKFIALKLARRFVSDTPPQELVDRAADTFRRTDGDIREVVRTIVTSPEFFSRAAYRNKVKSPFEVVASTLRALGAQPDATLRTSQLVATLGQPIYGHQSPNGWPEVGTEWMNTGAILNRINFGTMVGANRLPGVSSTNWPGADKLRNAPRDKQVDGVIAALLGGEASPDTRAILMSGENPFLKSAAAQDTSASANAAATMDPDPTMIGPPLRPLAGGQGPLRNLAFGPLPPLKGLAQLVGLAVGSPEFQRR
jgi:uncharacterized protein (DUF1800 family)